jgi:NADP-dependent aldehyde dehydrogenase
MNIIKQLPTESMKVWLDFFAAGSQAQHTSMELLGKNFIGGKPSARGRNTFSSVNPVTTKHLEPPFYEATAEEINEALELARTTFESYRSQPADRIGEFLELIAEEILALGDQLIETAQTETGLPQPRLIGERGRTVGQIQSFADLVREGSWVEASIDRAIPGRKPLPKPDVRRLLVPLGPVVVFGASNFPLAFSVAGGDTISALAAGNPVVVKAHPAHPGTSEMVGRAVQKAVERGSMPAGIFSLLHGVAHEVSHQLVRHPATKAVGFTGSLAAGRALFNLAAARPEPIRVYAEMGSTNPIFVLPGALKKSPTALAESLIQSVTLGAGQFCTNPGLVFGLADEAWPAFLEKAGSSAAAASPATMLYAGICERFHDGVEQFRKVPGVRELGKSTSPASPGQAPALVFETSAKNFLQHDQLHEELFGPATLLVTCSSSEDLENIARSLPGQLTGTIHGTEEDLRQHRNLVSILQEKVGRLIFNGFPTGVEVCPSMHHGGPYPATTDAHFTSVGTSAIKRFARPLCFQNFPDDALPIELRNRNERQIWRLVDGQLMRDSL